MKKSSFVPVRHWLRLVIILALGMSIQAACCGQSAVSADKPDSESTSTNDVQYPMQLTPEGEAIAQQLSEELPPGSEARAMFDAIMQGQRLNPRAGWFALSTSQTKYTWKQTLAAYDKNVDGKVEPAELPAANERFAAVDRNGDGALTEIDFDWKTPAPVPGAKKTKSEFVSNLSRDLLIKGLKNQEIGSLQAGPHVGDVAEDFQLNSIEGDKKNSLHELIGKQPVVLVFGNYTCAPFRRESADVKELYDRYKDQAQFAMVYVREAHPSDGWRMDQGSDKISLPQPRSDSERIEVAKQCKDHIKFDMPFLVDTIDDRVGAKYSGMPSRLYLIDQSGRIVYKSARGPFGFKPAELEQALVLNLAESALKK